MFGDYVKNDKKLSCLMLNISLVTLGSSLKICAEVFLYWTIYDLLVLSVLVILLSTEAASIIDNNSRRSLHKSRKSETEIEKPKIIFLDNEQLEAGHELSVGCISRNGFPPAQITWELDTELLNTVYQFEETLKEGESTSVISVIQWNLTTDDNNRNLICKARHPQYNDGLSIVRHKLVVNFKPIEFPTKIFDGFTIGDSVDILISFQSNPKPSSLIWLVGNKKIYYGTETSKYVSKEISADANSFWNAFLRVKNLTLEDTQLNYTLRVKNSFGFANYHFEIKGLFICFVMSWSTLKAFLFVADDFKVFTSNEDDESITTLTPLDVTDMESISSEQSFQNEENLTTEISFGLESTTMNSFQPDDNDETTIKTSSIEPSINETFISMVEEISTEWTATQDESVFRLSPYQENKSEQVEVKTKVSRVMIFKRPIRLKNGIKSETKMSMKTSQPVKEEFTSDIVKLFFIESASKAIIFWKSSLMLLVICLLIASLLYYRRRVKTLKAKIVEKNLGTPHSRSCSFNRSANAYTPTYFSQSVSSSVRVKELNRPRQREPTCSSNYYLQTYNSSLHSYVSIDALNNDHIYDEIPARKHSTSSYNKENHSSDSDSITSRKLKFVILELVSQIFSSI